MNRMRTSARGLGFLCLSCLLTACGPSQASLDSTATQAAAWAHATETAAAPTSTPVPTSTATPRPTSTATPTSAQAGPLFIGDPALIEMETFSVTVDGALVSLDIPAGLTGEFNPGREGELTVLFPVGDYVSIEMYTNVLTKTGVGEVSLEQYVDIFLERNRDRIQDLRRQAVTNREGFPVELLAWSQGNEGSYTAFGLVYVHERRIAVEITYLMPADVWMMLADAVIQSFDTFRVEDQ